jgi:hypothetical protein
MVYNNRVIILAFAKYLYVTSERPGDKFEVLDVILWRYLLYVES